LRYWVTAATCRARFSCRLPRGLSRCRCLGPLEAAMGAVPVERAKWPLVGEPDDGAGVAEDDRGTERSDAVDVGDRRARREDGLDDAFVDGTELVVEPADIAEQLESDPLGFEFDGTARLDAAQDPPGLQCRQQAAGAARRQPTQQGVEPADRLGPQPGQIVVPVRQQAQHRSVIHRGDLLQPGMAQRDDRRRPGVVRVGLVGAAGVEQPNARRQRRRHIHHRLAGGDKLLGEKRTQPRKRPRWPRSGA
jgi:hypothetical protein